MVQMNIRKAIICLCELAAGVLLWMNPEFLTKGIVCLSGGLLVIWGIWDAIVYFRTEALQAAKEQKLFFGLLKMGAGVLCLVKASWVVSALPALTMLYGVLLLIVSAQKIQWTVDMRRMKNRYWNLAAVSALVSLGFAVITMLNPFRTTQLLWKILGVVLGIEAIADGVILVLSNLNRKEAHKPKEEKVLSSKAEDEAFAPPEEIADLEYLTKTKEEIQLPEPLHDLKDLHEATADTGEENGEIATAQQDLIPEDAHYIEKEE